MLKCLQGYYLPTLLQQSVGFDQQMSRLLTACNGTSYLGSAFCCLLLIDLVGRRKKARRHFMLWECLMLTISRLMLYGSVTMGSCYLIAALCLQAGENDAAKSKTVSTAAPESILLPRADIVVKMGAVTTSMFFLYYFFYGTSYAKVSCYP